MTTLESGGLIVKDRVVSQHMNIILGVDLSSMSWKAWDSLRSLKPDDR